MVAGWREEAVGKGHDRKAFDCGDTGLNEFLRKYARQSHESGSAKTFVAVRDEAPGRVLGFYSLAPASLDYERMPGEIVKGLPRHPVPGFRLARLAVDFLAQGQGLGGQLLMAAGRRCARVAAEVGGVVLVIDAKNERAAAWYMEYGAVRLGDAPLTLVLALRTIEVALRDEGKI